MNKDNVMAYWFEEGTGELRSEALGPSDLLGPRDTYEREVNVKYATRAVGLIIIPLNRLTEAFNQDRLRDLERRAEARRDELAGKAST